MAGDEVADIVVDMFVRDRVDYEPVARDVVEAIAPGMASDVSQTAVVVWSRSKIRDEVFLVADRTATTQSAGRRLGVREGTRLIVREARRR